MAERDLWSPRGSILGAVLFIINIGELPEKLKNGCYDYADDYNIPGMNEIIMRRTWMHS